MTSTTLGPKRRLSQTISGAAAAAMLCAAGAATAQDGGISGRSNLYVAGNIGVSSLTDFDINDATGQLVVSPDIGINVNGAAGFRLNRAFRVEGELGYRHYGLDTVEVVGAGEVPANDGEVSGIHLMANAYADFGRTEFRPYVGGGLGVAVLDFGSIAFNTTQLPDNDDTVFAFQAIAGVSYLVSPKISLTADYRYFGTAAPTVEDSNQSETEIDGFGTHNFMLGVRYNF